jgi:hypothetical protein
LALAQRNFSSAAVVFWQRSERVDIQLPRKNDENSQEEAGFFSGIKQDFLVR